MKVKTAMFAIKLCDTCKELEVVGYKCPKCRLDRVVDEKIKLNIELVSKIQSLTQQLSEAREELSDLYGGKRGACFACEPVGELNKKITQQLSEARKELEDKKQVIKYLETFVPFCCECKNPSDDCIC